ncbi:DoxX family protein [Aquabacterium sp. J223]|uniref:DoxX family protein n=1 Tax=Aquabacterium sp. J223 TaxID=2898431 RepID=UPI0021AD6FE4|nr:DoxX family protein [Aquabacterium sp. J223]UUX95312.1 DoxX family protein [Aquabacterium sp. J223]
MNGLHDLAAGLERAVPLVEALLRLCVGAALVPYALRSSFGFFKNTGMPVSDLRGTAAYLDRYGWRPGMLWAVASTVNNLVGGSLLALGLLTRPAAAGCCLLLMLSAFHHLRKDGYFANQNGFEHYALWGVGCLYFVVRGGGPYSLDALLGWPL